MRIIVCGGRDFADSDLIRRVLSEYTHAKPTIVHGDCRGADKLAARIAEDELGFDVDPHPADWDNDGKAAGFIRNEQMARLGAGLCIAFPGGPGTKHMAERAQRYGIPVRRISEDERTTI